MIIEKITLIIFSQSFAEDKWNAIWQPAEIFCHNMVTFAQRPQTIKELLFSPKEPQNVPLHP